MNKKLVEKVLQRIDEELKPLPTIQFGIQPMTKSDIISSIDANKLGGAPWWPASKPFPKDSHNRYMALLVQLNFDKLPYIKDFPKTGMLQIFISETDCYGMNWNHPTSQDDFRVIYHDKVDLSYTMHTRDYYKSFIEDNPHYMLPINKSYLLTPLNPSEMKADAFDYRYEKLFVKYYNEEATNPIESIFDLDPEAKFIYNRNERATAFIGGYPIFSQDDPRYDKQYKKFNRVLFELDSYYDSEKGINIEWGDSGTGTFFIPTKNLRKLDFSEILYNFDCC